MGHSTGKILSEPDFTDDICRFNFQSDDPALGNEKTQFYKNVSVLPGQTVEQIEEEARTYENILFCCFFKLTEVSFDYKQLAEAIKKEGNKKFRNIENEALQLFLNTFHCNIEIMEEKKFETLKESHQKDASEISLHSQDVTGEDPVASKVQEDTSEFEKLLNAGNDQDAAEIEEQDKKLEKLNKKIKQQDIEMIEMKKNSDLEEMEISEENEKYLKKIEDKHREAEEKARKDYEEKLKKLRENREEFEKETERLRLEDLRELNERMAAFWKCVELKMDWEMKEDEWASWLKMIRRSVSKTKNQFTEFTDSVYSLEMYDAEGTEDIKKEDIFKLHCQTRSTFDFLREAYFKIKELSEKFPERQFLLILQKYLSKICSWLLSALHLIDAAENDDHLVENLKTAFSKFDSSDILYTSQLRNMEKSYNSESDEKIDDPENYEPKGGPVISEVLDENGTEKAEYNSEELTQNVDEKERPALEDLDIENNQ